MYKQYYALFVCSFALISFTAAAPPSFLKKCKSDDFKCMKESTKAIIPIFAKGLPEFNVQSLDPTTFKSIDASEGNLLFTLSDVTATGMSQCEPKKIQRDAAKSKMFIDMSCTGKLDGQYELKGNLLVIPIEGKGAIHVNLRSALISIILDLVDKIGEDGKNHWNVKSWTHTIELKEKSDVVFENLYKDNELLGRAARDLVANNGNEIILEIGHPVIKALVGRAVQNINKFFKSIPAEDLSID